MAKKPTAAEKKATAAAKKETKSGQGSAVVLPNGVRRIDFIRDSYYTNGKHTEGKDPKRGDIRTDINTMLEKAGKADEQIPYQIVFAATKTDVDPRVEAAKKAAAKPAKKEPAKKESVAKPGAKRQ